MSKTNADFKLKGYPTFRLYTKPGVFEEFKEEKLELLELKKFLKKNKVNGFFDLKVASQPNPNLKQGAEDMKPVTVTDPA